MAMRSWRGWISSAPSSNSGPSAVQSHSLSAGARMKTTPPLLLLLFFFLLQATLRAEVEHRNEAERGGEGGRGCANLSLVLDNWKYAITTQVKDLLLHDHSTVLPDYGRIPPLSDALGDLYKEFSALKERLAELTAKFDGVEAFVDGARAGRGRAPPRAGPPARRTRVVVRRVHKPSAAP